MISEYLKKHGACVYGMKWAVKNCESMAEVWDTCPRPDWFLWLVEKELQPFKLRQLCCRFLKETPLLDINTGTAGSDKIWEFMTDPRSERAVNAAEGFYNGSVSHEELSLNCKAAKVALLEIRSRYAVKELSFFPVVAASAAVEVTKVVPNFHAIFTDCSYLANPYVPIKGTDYDPQIFFEQVIREEVSNPFAGEKNVTNNK